MSLRLDDVIRGDDCFYEITFKDVDGNPIDLTGCIVFFTAKKNITDTDAQAVIRKEIDDFAEPTEGIAILHLTNEDTSSLQPRYYFFDVQVRDTADQITSSKRGTMIVNKDVTIRTHDDLS